jgi:PhoD-like phosphatase
LVPDVVLGPVQRGIGTAGLRIWLEVDAPCEVEVLGHRDHTWTVEGHHYALVELDRIEPGTETNYDVRLDGEVVWPVPGDTRPRPRIRSWDEEAEIRLVVGSCRQAAPPSRLQMEESEEDPPGLGADALAALSEHLQRGDRTPVHGLVLLGDQVYADEPDPRTIEAMRERRGGPPEDGCPEVTSFEEYTWLYQEAWRDPDIAWLLASVPSVMIFDDHDIIDDWNISDTWHDEIEQHPWWRGRIVGGLLAYWVYQHIGNVAVTEGADSDLLAAV